MYGPKDMEEAERTLILNIYPLFYAKILMGVAAPKNHSL